LSLVQTVLSAMLWTRHRRTAVCPRPTLTLVGVCPNDGVNRSSTSSPPCKSHTKRQSSATGQSTINCNCFSKAESVIAFCCCVQAPQNPSLVVARSARRTNKAPSNSNLSNDFFITYLGVMFSYRLPIIVILTSFNFAHYYKPFFEKFMVTRPLYHFYTARHLDTAS